MGISSKIISFFEKIRAAEEPVRKWWLIILTSATMVLVITFWVGYLNISIKSPIQESSEKNTASAKAVVSETSFLETFGAGITVVTSELRERTKNLQIFFKNSLQESHTITIEKPERDFTLDSLEAVPKTTLP